MLKQVCFRTCLERCSKTPPRGLTAGACGVGYAPLLAQRLVDAIVAPQRPLDGAANEAAVAPAGGLFVHRQRGGLVSPMGRACLPEQPLLSQAAADSSCIWQSSDTAWRSLKADRP